MTKPSDRIILISLASAGAIVWIIIGAMTNQREAWDSDLFWLLGNPLMLLINGIAGFIDPKNIIVKGFILVLLQPVVMIITAAEIGGLLPLGLILFVFLGIFYSIGGAVGAFIKKNFFSSNTHEK